MKPEGGYGRHLVLFDCSIYRFGGISLSDHQSARRLCSKSTCLLLGVTALQPAGQERRSSAAIFIQTVPTRNKPRGAGVGGGERLVWLE